MMKNEEAYKEVLEMKNKIYELCKENDMSLIFMLENENEVTGSIYGKQSMLKSMLCGFLVEKFDTQEISEIFERVNFFTSYRI